MTKEIEWDPDHHSLKDPNAPHETAAVMRWHRSKVPSQEILKMLRMRGTVLIKKLEDAMEQERVAHESGRPIHDDLIQKGTK